MPGSGCRSTARSPHQLAGGRSAIDSTSNLFAPPGSGLGSATRGAKCERARRDGGRAAFFRVLVLALFAYELALELGGGYSQLEADDGGDLEVGGRLARQSPRPFGELRARALNNLISVSRRQRHPIIERPTTCLLHSIVVSLFALPLPCKAQVLDLAPARPSGDQAAVAAAAGLLPNATNGADHAQNVSDSPATMPDTYQMARGRSMLINMASARDNSGPKCGGVELEQIGSPRRQLEFNSAASNNNKNNNSSNETAESLSAATQTESSPVAGATTAAESHRRDRYKSGFGGAQVGAEEEEERVDPLSSSSSKTKHAAEWEAALAPPPMAMTFGKGIKRMWQQQQQQQQQQKQQQQQQHLTMTRKTKTSTAKRQVRASAVDSASGAMNSVVCNSRCKCVRLEFSAFGRPAGPASESKVDGVAEGDKTAGVASLERGDSQIGAGGPLISEAATRKSESAQSDDSGSSGARRIALIEFSQDYSLDDGDELDTSASSAQLNEQQAGQRATSAAIGGPRGGRNGGEPLAASAQQRAADARAASEGEQTTPTGNGLHQRRLREQQTVIGQPPTNAPMANGAGNVDRTPPTTTTTTTTMTGLTAAAEADAPNQTIGHANDQSKVVNVSAVARPAPGPAVLSIKDNKTEGGVAVAGPSGKWAIPKQFGADKDEAGAAPGVKRTSSAASAANLYPYLSAHHQHPRHQHQQMAVSPPQQWRRHHLVNHHQLDPFFIDDASTQGEGGGAGATTNELATENNESARRRRQRGRARWLSENALVKAASGGNSELAAMAAAAAIDGLAFGEGGVSGREEDWRSLLDQISAIVPLKVRSETNLNSTESIIKMLTEIGAQSDQSSLSLRKAGLKFELWTEIYSLLMIEMRRNLFQLDLSHNDLVKLGVTFTGYIEHHFAYQLIVNNNQSWPFSSTGATSASSTLAGVATTNATLQQQQLQQLQQQQQQQQQLQIQQQQTANYLSNTYFNFMQLQSSKPNLPLPQAQTSSKSLALSAASARSINPAAPATAVVATTSSGGSGSGRRLQLRHANLGDGKLYNLVRSQLPIDTSLLIIKANTSSPNAETGPDGRDHLLLFGANLPQQPPTQSATTKQQQHQQLFPTILHQAAQIRALDLSYNKLRWLINDQFRVLKHVQSIRLDHNQIRFIHQQAFNGLEALKYLNLNDNRIQTIYMEQFQTNYNLLALFLRSNYLTYLRAGTLASLNQLRRLDLSKNKFTMMSGNAFVGLESLELLNMSSNQFVHVPSTSFHSLASNLRRLDMSRNQLAQLMPGAFFHLNLDELLLESNDQLVEIDRGAFWDLPELTSLSLKSNPILLSINSQAFVGVPNLKLINYEDCQALDLISRQMLDNITMATTLRILTQQQQQNENYIPGGRLNSSEIQDGLNVTVGSLNAPSLLNFKQVSTQQSMLLALSNQQMSAFEMKLNEPFGGLGSPTALNWFKIKHFYSFAFIIFVIVALKFLFKYTSTRHYLNIRRRRRRVYQSPTSKPSSSLSSGASSRSSASDVDSKSAQNLDDEIGDLEINEEDDYRDEGSSSNDQSFMMLERGSSLNVLRRSVKRRQGGDNYGADIVRSSPISISSVSITDEGGNDYVGHDNIDNNSHSATINVEIVAHNLGDGHRLDEQQHLGLQQYDFCQNELVSDCPDCCSQQQQQCNGVIIVPDSIQLTDETGINQQQQAIAASERLLQQGTAALVNRANLCDNNNNDAASGPIAGKALGRCLGPARISIDSRAGEETTRTGSATSTSPANPSVDSNDVPPQQIANFNLIHSQLVAAGLDYGHANCVHFYQSLGPALQLANLDASFVNQTDC